MPPVVNTYGTRKKKRLGIPKFIYRADPESEDIFDSLKMDRIKESKALVDEERKNKKKRKESSRVKTVPSHNYGSSADLAFDRLFNESSLRDNSLRLNSSDNFSRRSLSDSRSSTCSVEPFSNAFSNKGKKLNSNGVITKRKRRKKVAQDDSFFTKPLPVSKVTRAWNKGMNTSSEDESFSRRLHGKRPDTELKTRRKSNTSSSESYSISVKSNSSSSQEKKKKYVENQEICERKSDELSILNNHDKENQPSEFSNLKHRQKKVYKLCSPISPILPFGSTSTPSGTNKRIPFKLSPVTLVDLCDSTACSQGLFTASYNLSSDFLFSPEWGINPNPQANEGCVSVDLFSSIDQPVSPVGRSQPSNIIHSTVNVTDLSSQCSCAENVQMCAGQGMSYGNSSSCLKTDGCGLDNVSCGELDDNNSNVVESSETESNCTNCSCHLSNKYDREENGCQSAGRLEDILSENCKCCVDTQETSLNSSQVMVYDVSKSLCEPVLEMNNLTAQMREISLSSTAFQGSHSCEQHCVNETSVSCKKSACYESVGVAGVDSFVGEREKSSFVSQKCVCEELSKTNQDSSMDSNYGCTGFNLESVRECRVELQRCEIPQKTEDNKKPHTELECRVILSRCDELESKCRTDTMLSEDILLCESRVVSGSLSQPLSPKSDHTEKLELLSDSIIVMNDLRESQNFRRQSNIQEVVALKPGKQWRRSLSILSKIRSSGEFPVDDSRAKGKLWESTVNTVIQMQSTREVICEESESSFTSSHQESFEHSQFTSDPLSRTSSLASCHYDGASEIFRRCDQKGPLPFLECYPEMMRSNCQKIGEGVYGEVFLYSGSRDRKPSVIKIIPIEGELEVNGEPQKTFKEILSEVCVAQELSKLRTGMVNVTTNFNEVQAIRCVQGRYPQWLVDLWCEFDERKGSENDSPEMFSADQLYIVLELSNGGKDLESFVFTSAVQGLAAFRQIALTLAVGERALQFEHRDLHWGNVLLSSTKDKDINFVLDGETLSTSSKGIEVCIIDFTLSRINDPHTSQPIFYDLAKDETLFTAQGDYQFEVYRMMKDYCGNQWDIFSPQTNIAWLHYLLDKLCTQARYKSRSSKVHQHAIDVLSELKDTILMYSNVTSFVKCSLFSS